VFLIVFTLICCIIFVFLFLCGRNKCLHFRRHTLTSWHDVSYAHWPDILHIDPTLLLFLEDCEILYYPCLCMPFFVAFKRAYSLCGEAKKLFLRDEFVLLVRFRLGTAISIILACIMYKSLSGQALPVPGRWCPATCWQRSVSQLHGHRTVSATQHFLLPDPESGTICHRNCDTWTSALDNSETCWNSISLGFSQPQHIVTFWLLCLSSFLTYLLTYTCCIIKHISRASNFHNLVESQS